MSITNARPAYRILAVHGFFGPDDHLWPDGAEIYYDGEPNEEMEPLNDLAREKMEAYLNKLDNLAKIAAEKFNKPFVGRPRTLDGAIVLATEYERDRIAIMGVKKEVTNIQSVRPAEIPEVGGVNVKRGRGRPVGTTKQKITPLSSVSPVV